MPPANASAISRATVFRSYIVFEGARERAAEKEFRLEHFWLGENGALAKRASQILYTRDIKGILLAPLPDFLSSLDLEWERFYTVALGFSLASPVLDRVTTDHLIFPFTGSPMTTTVPFGEPYRSVARLDTNASVWQWVPCMITGCRTDGPRLSI